MRYNPDTERGAGMTLYEFMGTSPVLTFCLAALLLGAFRSVLFLRRQPLRTYNIRRNGWPPAHLDADGDYKAHKLVEAQAKAAEQAAERAKA